RLHPGARRPQAHRRASGGAEHRPHAEGGRPGLRAGQGPGRRGDRESGARRHGRRGEVPGGLIAGEHRGDGPMSWLDTPYRARKGVAKGKAGATHQLNEAVQGRYHYVYGPYADPVLRIKPGDVVVVETQDAFEGKITKESDSPSKLLNVPFLNPQ